MGKWQKDKNSYYALQLTDFHPHNLTLVIFKMECENPKQATPEKDADVATWVQNTENAKQPCML